MFKLASLLLMVGSNSRFSGLYCWHS